MPYTGWKKTALMLVAGAAIAVPATNAMPLGRPSDKEPPTPGILCEPPPSGGSGPTGTNFDPPTGGGGGSGGSNFDPQPSGGGGGTGSNFGA